MWFGPWGTFGRACVLDGDDGGELAWCYSLEPPTFPWVPENARDLAAIPVGEYRLERGVFHRGTERADDDYPCLVIPDGEVPGRGRRIGDPASVPGLKIHAGNTLANTLGCPLLGERIGFLGEVPAVLASRKALARILGAIGVGVGARLRVREARPASEGRPA